MAQVSNMAHKLHTLRVPTLHAKPSAPTSNSLLFGSKCLKNSLSYSWVLDKNHIFTSEKKNSFKVVGSVATAEKPSTVPEIVLHPIKEISGTVNLPRSKSFSNRILLLAALSEGTTIVENLLNSDYIHYMLGTWTKLKQTNEQLWKAVAVYFRCLKKPKTKFNSSLKMQEQQCALWLLQ